MIRVGRNIEDSLNCHWGALIIAGVVASLAGTAVATLGARSSAKAQQKAADYNAAVATNDADVAGQQARFAAEQIRLKTARQVGMQRAAMASSGFDPNSGSFTDVTNDMERRGELERLTAIYEGGLGVNRATSAATLYRMQGDNAMVAGNYAMASSILGGVGQATSIGASYYANRPQTATANPTF